MAILLLPQKNINLTKNLKAMTPPEDESQKRFQIRKKMKECSSWKTKVKTRGLNGRQ